LNTIPGVRNAKVETGGRHRSVEVDGADREAHAACATSAEAEFREPRKGLQPLPEEVRRTLDIASASEGPEIELAKVLVPGKVTLIDYWASWCGPCHLLDARLQRLARAQPKLAVRRVNVAKFENPAGKQAVREFRMRAIPYVRVYDARGRFVGEDRDGNWETS
jgi:thiol-disulfide isomerase/thioredoxin